jgi:hypothetical protein
MNKLLNNWIDENKKDIKIGAMCRMFRISYSTFREIRITGEIKKTKTENIISEKTGIPIEKLRR